MRSVLPQAQDASYEYFIPSVAHLRPYCISRVILVEWTYMPISGESGDYMGCRV